MKLSLASLKDATAWKGYELPAFDVQAVAEKTKAAPTWLHFGAGNLFRAFQAAVAQRLIENGDMDTGIITCESYDDEIVTKCFHKVDNLTVAVTLEADGRIEKQVIGSVAETTTLLHDLDRVREIFAAPSLQMVSFTITEKGYSLRNAKQELVPVVAEDMKNGPAQAKSFMAQLATLLLHRMHNCGKPLAMVSMDNCSHNGAKLQGAIMEIVDAWKKNGLVTAEEYAYLTEQVTFPWSMIDKITPRPAPEIADQLEADGLEDMHPFVTSKNTYIAPFVNAERPQYLVIENDFPNGRPPLDKCGVIFTDRDTVNKVEMMKVCTCLNPPQTALAVYGCLLGYTSIAKEVQDHELYTLIDRMCHIEGMPVVVNPGVLSPQAFLDEVFETRLPNPFIPDTPQRIATDTSQKVSIRFGNAIKNYDAMGKASELTYIPLVLAGWLRYLLAVDDEGKAFECSADPLLASLQEKLSGITLGNPDDAAVAKVRPILSDAAIFGIDLAACGLADKVIGYWKEMMAGPGAIRATLKKYTA
ncbi:mannitol dehydrogenase family protein [Agathobaculum sp.]|uniref:mannitol dehydrogenase family protein n=1 Tax=Agathobaculum sp. TaxID=2048138 RepID=UPI002A811322|nr:mannitol dehydrogenase family protein [Agathobaculum sp.]MDY3618479.1 mannitol dehydrogenase family protein [Agathobaculum sp.]